MTFLTGELPDSDKFNRELGRCGVRCGRVATQAVTTATGTDILFDTEYEDTNAFITASVGVPSTTVTVPFDGIYSISAHVDTANATGIVLQQLSVSSSLTGASTLYRTYTPSGEPFGLVTAAVELLAGDSFRLTVLHNTGSNKNYKAYLQAFRVGS